MTPILKVIQEYCSVYVDDIRLEELASVNPPLYSFKMWSYLLPAISLFTLPSEMQGYIAGTTDEPNIIYPKFAGTQYTQDTEQTAPFIISLGAEYSGYELVSCRIKTTYPNGSVEYTQADFSYNAETGDITVDASADRPVPAGTVFDFDFYTDGQFKNTLSAQIMNILGMCFQVVWQDRFNTDWLSNVSKIEDASFKEQNRANKENADTARIKELREKLAGEMRRFEQNAYYRQVVSSAKKLKL